MSLQYRRVALFGKYPESGSAPLPEQALQVLREIAGFLRQIGCDVTLDHRTAENLGLSDLPSASPAELGAACDVGVVVGGDGTMLGVGREMAPHGLPLIGINQGRLGFITDIPLDSFRDTLPAMLAGQVEQDHRTLLHSHVMRGPDCAFEALAMNDVVVDRGGSTGMVELRIEVDGHFVSNQRADGLIIATPTGSTAYALSAGGPLMDPALRGWALVPIAPHTLSNRPIVLADPSEIAVEIVAGRGANANFDNQSFAALQIGDRVVVRRSTHEALFLHPIGWSYFDTLRKKLHWNARGG